jgi:hypothetical protein
LIEQFDMGSHFDSLLEVRVTRLIRAVHIAESAKHYSGLNSGQIGLASSCFPQASGFGQELICKGTRVPELRSVGVLSITMASHRQHSVD